MVNLHLLPACDKSPSRDDDILHASSIRRSQIFDPCLVISYSENRMAALYGAAIKLNVAVFVRADREAALLDGVELRLLPGATYLKLEFACHG